MTVRPNHIAVTRWNGSQHPSTKSIARLFQAEGYRPYEWENQPNHRYAVRSHNFHKILYVLDGTVEIQVPDANQSVRLRAGDRIDIPPGVRYGCIVGGNGATCMEASVARRS